MLFVLILFSLSLVKSQDVTCSQNFCDEHLTNNPCGGIPEKCTIQNATHNGLELPFPGPCNCCDYCLENLAEGATCAVGTPTSSVPNNICGDGLQCSDKKICVTINTKCTRAQKEYDNDRENGQLGNLQIRPTCDRNGEYKPFVCVPGEICYCVDADGERIFGEIPYSAVAQYILKCQCSRAHRAASKFLGRKLQTHEHMRCQSNGNFDTIQCVDEKCLCVDSEDAKPTFPGKDLVNITLISAKTLPCFDNKSHVEFDYYRLCEDKFMKKYKEIKQLEKDNLMVVGSVYPSCQLDGYYDRVQHNETHKYCVDPLGNTLEDFAIEIISAKEMNCNCALTRYLITDVEKPQCCPNGNYNKMQCRRGECRCVDDNGNQIVKEVPAENMETLPCYKTQC